MAIANTYSEGSISWSSSNPATDTSVDCNGGDILIVNVFTNNTVSAISATYNGTSMTLLNLGTDYQNNKAAVFYLVNPASGSNTLSITRTGGANISAAYAAYSGVDTTSPIDDWVFDAGSVSTTSYSTTNISIGDSNNWWIVGFRPDGAASDYTSSEVTERVRCGVVPTSIWDSNGTIGSTGSQNVTWSISPSRRIWGVTSLSLQVAGGGGGGPAFTPKVMWFS